MFQSEDASNSSPPDLLFAALNESGLTAGKSDSMIIGTGNGALAGSKTYTNIEGLGLLQRNLNVIRLPFTLNNANVGTSSSMGALTKSLQGKNSVNHDAVKLDTTDHVIGDHKALNGSDIVSKDFARNGIVLPKTIVVSNSSTATPKTTHTYARVTIAGQKLLIPVTQKLRVNAFKNCSSDSNQIDMDQKGICNSKSHIQEPQDFNLGSLFVERAEKEATVVSPSTVLHSHDSSKHQNDCPNSVDNGLTTSMHSSNTCRKTNTSFSPVKDILSSLSTLRSQPTLRQQPGGGVQPLSDTCNEGKRDSSLTTSEKSSDVLVEDEEIEEEIHHASTYAEYMPRKLTIGLPHPDRVVETSSLSSVPPPDLFYNVSISQEVIDRGMLSSLQLETIAYACQKHTTFLQSGERAGFLIGDGAGVGKGRTIAGIIYENYLMGRKRALWFSVSNDLKYDSERDLRDIGAGTIHVHMLNKFKYGKISSRKNCSVKKGVIFATYSSLIGESHFDTRYGTRLKQLLHWCGKNFDGVIVFDECHKAKNLIPSGSAKPTKTGYTVLELQKQLPNARVIYSSATGASEPRNMAYMSRLGLWGERTPFVDFLDFIQAVEKRGVGAMELVAMDLKSRGAYIARQLSFQGVSFKIEEVSLTNKFIKMYNEAVRLWVAAKEAFQAAALLIDAEHHMKKTMWGQFWAAHQRFFKYLCIAAKVDHASQLAKEAVRHGKCVVIGLQSTGEARTLDLLEKYGELDDFVSTAKGVFQSLVENHFPAPDRKRITDLFGSDFYNDDSKPDNRKGQNKIGRKRQRSDNMQLASSEKKYGYYENKLSDSINRDTDSGTDKSESDESFICSDEDIGRIFGGGSESEEWVCNSEGKSKKKRLADCTRTKRVGNGVNYCSEVVTTQYPENESGEPEFVAIISSDIDKQKTELLSLKESHKNPITKAQALKEELLEKIESINLPTNTLDALIDALGGPENVAEMTGRRGRIVATEDGNIKYESRTENHIRCNMLNLAEKQRFMDGSKNIAIISEAASSGISLQSDRRARNQRRRLHLTLELPWSADRAIQQFGRTHRSNQVSAPEYIFLISELAGEQRFASVVAKRLESLGALTHGDRRAAETRDLSQYNFDNKFGRIALDSIMKSIAGLELPLVQPPQNYPGFFFHDMRLAMTGTGLISYDSMNASPQLEKDYNNILKFMNRILGMEVVKQNAVFQFFSGTLSAIVQKAKIVGQLDQGILDIGTKEDCVENMDRQCFQLSSKFSVPQESNHGYVELHTLRAERGMSWENAVQMFSQMGTHADDGFYITQSKKKNKCMTVLCFEKLQTKRKHSNLEVNEMTGHRHFQLFRPNVGKQVKLETLSSLRNRYRKVEAAEAEKWWKIQYQTSSDICSHEYWLGSCSRHKQQGFCNIGKRRRVFHVLSGSVFAVWRTVERVLSAKMPSLYKMQIVRFKTQDGVRLVGVLIPSTCVEHLTWLLRNPGDLFKIMSTPSNLYLTGEKKGQNRSTETTRNYERNDLKNCVETVDAENSSDDEMDEDFSPDKMNSLVLFSNRKQGC